MFCAVLCCAVLRYFCVLVHPSRCSRSCNCICCSRCSCSSRLCCAASPALSCLPPANLRPQKAVGPRCQRAKGRRARKKKKKKKRPHANGTGGKAREGKLLSRATSDPVLLFPQAETQLGQQQQLLLLASSYPLPRGTAVKALQRGQPGTHDADAEADADRRSRGRSWSWNWRGSPTHGTASGGFCDKGRRWACPS